MRRGRPVRRVTGRHIRVTRRESAGPRRVARGWAPVVLLGALALLGLGTIGVEALQHESTHFDGAVQAWVLAHQRPIAARTFLWITILGGIMGMRVLALVGAASLWYRGRGRIALVVLVAPVLADALFNVLKRVIARPRPLGLGGPVDDSHAFPSGHSTVSAAVCCTLAYVLWREGLIGRSAAITLAVAVPLLVGCSRVYLNVHWATDVLGGWCAGILIAILCCAPYAHWGRPLAADRASTPSTASGPFTP